MEFLERLVDWAHAGLQESDEAQSYLRGRGSSSEQWTRHRMGFVQGDFDVDPKQDPGHTGHCFEKDRTGPRCDSCRYRIWSSEWIEDEDKPKEQIVGRRIRGSIVLPLTSYSGALVGFQTRSIAEKNYDNFVLNRRPEAYAFGLGPAVHHAWGNKSIFAVEGPFDHQLIERLVSPSVMALTTSSINQLQMGFLKRFVKRIFWCGDLDKAGRDGLASLLQYHGSDFDVVDVKYPRIQEKDKDVGDYWRRVGDDKFAAHFRRIL